jgi:NAD(P)-dependent dehydrogenase (short-subunit alcohol dehydrogenase family)
MQARGYGRIVNIASNAAIGTALPGTTFYAATKAEVLILTRRLAMELGRRGVTVNAVAPGLDRDGHGSGRTQRGRVSGPTAH